MKTWITRACAGLVASGLCAGLAPAVLAAPAEIEEIVVTAQKRESALQETPIAITAMTQSQIALNRIEDFSDIALHTPSMSYTELQGFSQIAIRGVGTDLTNLANETAVAMYEDGVYRGATFAQTVPQFDMERIEVLRGPQGTLYGRNATGGAVNIITRMPSFDPEFNASITGGNYDHMRGEIGASGALVDDLLAGRASFVYDSHSGWNDNHTLGDSEGDDSLKGGHASLLFNLSDKSELVLRGNYTRDHGSSGVAIVRELAPNQLGITPANVGGFLTFPQSGLGGLSLAQVFGLTFPQARQPVVVDPNDFDSYTEQPTKNNIKQYGYSATLTHQFDNDVTAKLIVAREDAKWVRYMDVDGTNIQMLTQDGQQSNRQNTAELNISGTYWGGRASWMLGGFYFQEDGNAHFYYDLAALQTTYEAIYGLSPGGPGVPLPPGSLQVLFPYPRLKTGLTSPVPFLDFRGNQNSKSYAGFGQTVIDVVDNLHLTLGVRYTDDTKDMHRELSNNLGGAPCDQRINQDWNETTGQGILSYDVNKDLMTYVSASKGFKAGGFNVAECTGAFDPETIWAYEWGAKSQWFDRRLQLNGAVFVYKYDDIQINRFVLNTSSITNAAKADIYGAELEFVALLGGGFETDGGVTYLNTQYGGGASFSDPILGGPPISVDGNDLLRSPPWKAYWGAQYEWDTGLGRFTLRGDVVYSDSFYFDVFNASLPNQKEMKQDAYTITNAHLQWDSTDGKYSGQLFCQNIGNELYAYSSQAVGTTGAVESQYSQPRTYGLRLSMKMGGK
jgi:iron complex outermembrane receptor protein